VGYNPSYKWINPTYPIYNWGYNPLTKWDGPPSRGFNEQSKVGSFMGFNWMIQLTDFDPQKLRFSEAANMVKHGDVDKLNGDVVLIIVTAK